MPSAEASLFRCRKKKRAFHRRRKVKNIGGGQVLEFRILGAREAKDELH